MKILKTISQCLVGCFFRIGPIKNLFISLVLLIASPWIALKIFWFFPSVMVLICTIGAALGGFLLNGAMVTFVQQSGTGRTDLQYEKNMMEKEEIIHENERLKYETSAKDQELGKAQEENLHLELEMAKLQSEKERLERMRIHVDSATPNLKLGLLKVQMTAYDLQQKQVDLPAECEEGFPGFKKKVRRESEYVGLQRIMMEANLGIDLKQVKVVEDGGILYVSGVKSESHGISRRETKWLIKEIRKKHIVDGEIEDYGIDIKDPRIMDLVLNQEQSMESRLNQGLGFAEHDRTIHRIAEGYIRLLLSPTGKQIEFLPPEDESDSLLLPLERYIEKYNMEINSRHLQIVQKEWQIEQRKDSGIESKQAESPAALPHPPVQG
jgi:hypothetical protein